MDKGDKSGGPPGGGMVVLALLTAGVVFVANKPLESSRPVQPEQRVERREATQDIDARLWQDPLTAVAKARDLVLKQGDEARKREAQAHGEQQFGEELRRQSLAAGPGGVAVLAVMVSGGPYVERVESRLRTRYAVLAGLNARGFVPVDNEHLGYFRPQPGAGLPEIVPFERFQATADNRSGRGEDCQRCRLVVLWLDSGDFYEAPLSKLTRLAERVAPTTPWPLARPVPMRWRVVGPSSSEELRAMVEEAAEPGFDAQPQARFDMRYFSGAATVPDATLLAGTPGASQTRLVDYMHSRGVHLRRTVTTDDKLAEAMVRELKLRGLRVQPDPDVARAYVAAAKNAPKEQPRPGICRSLLAAQGLPGDTARLDYRQAPSTIAIVSEWDTLYGRSLRQGFRYADSKDLEHPVAKDGLCPTRYYYVRGLDGRLPGDPASPGADARPKKDGKADIGEALAGDGSYLERPEGQSQFDYLRRLAQRIRDEDAALRRERGRDAGIRAIGVLGNDVYDKLLVLQALQPELPHAIFFTTDLDARMFHPREQAWARNLLVASSFGLQLDKPLQRGFAPFRDSYQTSAYFSTMLAMDDLEAAIANRPEGAPSQATLDRWLEQPRVFEVSRTGLFDYSRPPKPDADARVEAAGACDRWDLQACRSIHPPASVLAPPLPLAARYLVAALLMLALWAPALVLSRRRRRGLRRFVARGGHGPGSGLRRFTRACVLGVAALLLAVVPPLLLALAWPDIAGWLTEGGDGKPLSFADGISPWPTFAIRALALVLCIYMVTRAWSVLGSNVDRIAREFKLGATRRQMNEQLGHERQRHRGWRRLTAMLALRFYPERPGLLGGHAGMTPAAVEFWKYYLVRNRLSARVLRTLLGVVALFLLSWLVSQAFGDEPLSPRRGDLARLAQPWTGLFAGGAIAFLIFFVADATLLCVFFVRGLRLHRANWPQRTLQAFNASTGVPPEYLDDWIDLAFVARRTRVVGALVYYPFVLLSLMLLARSSFFDDWYTPPSMIVMSALSFGIVLACAFALRFSAEASRVHAVERLRDGILRARGAGNSGLASQLELLRDRVEKLSDGAFAPYSRQPLLKAVLLPLLTFGGSSLFDYLTLANL